MSGDIGVDAGDPAQHAREQESVMVGAMPVEWTPGSSSPKTWPQRLEPMVLAQVECYTRRSAASRHPSRWRGAATSM
jgi:hypothetical protein